LPRTGGLRVAVFYWADPLPTGVRSQTGVYLGCRDSISRITYKVSYRHPEWQEFCAEVIHFYEEIAEKALENKKKS